MDSGLSFALAGEERRGRDLFNENVPIFQKSLQKELNNITLPGEGELANKIKRGRKPLSGAGTDLLGHIRPGGPAQDVFL